MVLAVLGARSIDRWIGVIFMNIMRLARFIRKVMLLDVRLERLYYSCNYCRVSCNNSCTDWRLECTRYLS